MPTRTAPGPARLRADAAHLSPRLVELRRQIHRRPEVGLDLPHTRAAVLSALEGLPLELRRGTACSSVTGVLRSGRPGPVVLLRADMDALPLQECSGEEFTSEVDGAMHACGHDLHVAALVGAAHLLSRHLDELTGDVVLMFQPGEEGHDGARTMLDEGVLEAAGRRPDAGYAVHVFGDQPEGVFLTRPGTMMAAADSLHVRVVGSGGHGSTPHTAADPIQAACAVVTGLQTVLTRHFDAFDPVVLTVGTFHAGTSRSIIPETATFEATVRSFSAAARERAESGLTRACHELARAHGTHAEVEFRRGYPATVNDAEQEALVVQTIAEQFGPGRHETLAHPSAAAEDFSRIAQQVPSVMTFVGAGIPGCAAPNHSPRARFAEGAITDAATLLAALALTRTRHTDRTSPPGPCGEPVPAAQAHPRGR